MARHRDHQGAFPSPRGKTTGSSATPWRAELAHLEACLHGSIEQPDEALAALASAHDDGSWWDPRILLEDDDLEALRGRPAFLDLVESSRGRWQAANAALDRGGDLLELPTGPPLGLLVALQGRRRTAPTPSAPGVTPSTLPDELRRLPVVAAGFSAGGRVALRGALTGVPHPVVGVVAVAPAVTPADLPPASAAGLAPARLVVGSDDDLLEDIRAAGERLAPAGFRVDVVPGLGHAFPADFGERLTRLLRAVAGG